MPMLKDFTYHAPQSLKEALQLFGRSQKPLLLAGGTFVLNTLKKTSAAPQDVISLRKVKECQGIREEKNFVGIGAMTTLDEIISSQIVQKHAPVLGEACRKVGTTPLRNMATIGGNVASRFYWVDLPCVLMALGAKAEWVTAKGVKKETCIGDFLKDKTAVVLLRILVPCGKKGFYFRHTQAMDVDLPVLALAFSCQKQAKTVTEISVCVNTTLSFPQRLKTLETLWTAQFPQDAGQVREALRKDLGSVCDEDRLALLETDLESLMKELR